MRQALYTLQHHFTTAARYIVALRPAALCPADQMRGGREPCGQAFSKQALAAFPFKRCLGCLIPCASTTGDSIQRTPKIVSMLYTLLLLSSVASLCSGSIYLGSCMRQSVAPVARSLLWQCFNQSPAEKLGGKESSDLAGPCLSSCAVGARSCGKLWQMRACYVLNSILSIDSQATAAAIWCHKCGHVRNANCGIFRWLLVEAAGRVWQSTELYPKNP